MNRTRTDEELIEQFLAESRDEAETAFELLVRRHGPMVMGVCRHILHRSEDAEDAFQETFLTLARKAGMIRNRIVLPAWLHEVAYRIANRMRSRVCRFPAQVTVADPAAQDDAPEAAASRQELGELLNAELDRLPERYRTLVVQCYLKGKTNREVARLLDCPVGTVKGQLFQARELLRRRLSQTDLDLNDTGTCAGLARRLPNSSLS
jgi:RNA polymerase sigma factor (sigma-70 family)